MWYLFGTFFSFFFLFLRGKPPLLSQSVCSSFDHMGNFKILKQALCFVCYTTYLNECYNPCFIWLKCNFKRVDISSWVFSFCKPIFERWVILEVCINELLFFVKLEIYLISRMSCESCILTMWQFIAFLFPFSVLQISGSWVLEWWNV